MIAFDLIVGILLLFAGRNLFWLCVGIIGFLIGVQCAPSLGFSDNLTGLIAAFGLGFIGIFLAIAFEWLAVVFGVGFLGGGYLLMTVFSLVVPVYSFAWVIFVIGGILGMCLMIITFDLTLILISSLIGATLIVNTFHTTEVYQAILFASSLAVGIVVQYFILKGTDRSHGVERLT